MRTHATYSKKAANPISNERQGRLLLTRYSCADYNIFLRNILNQIIASAQAPVTLVQVIGQRLIIFVLRDVSRQDLVRIM
jgi:hypothetical protein